MIKLPAILDKIETMKDRSLKLIFSTNEIPPKMGGELFSYSNDYCYLAIKKEEFQQSEIDLMESLKVEEFESKTPSKRMRNILFRLWQQDNLGYEDPNQYYQYRMNLLCEMLKNEFNA